MHSSYIAPVYLKELIFAVKNLNDNLGGKMDQMIGKQDQMLDDASVERICMDAVGYSYLLSYERGSGAQHWMRLHPGSVSM